MRIGDLAPDRLAAALAGEGLVLRTGPFASRLRSPVSEVRPAVAALYPDFPLAEDALVDFHVSLDPVGGPLHGFLRRAEFRIDDMPILRPYSRDSAPALIEWGLNACIYGQAHQYLIVHAGTVARGDAAILFPGTSGTGKSTMCAALAAEGWWLLSDEMAIVRPGDGRLMAVARPVSLKNESIEVIRARYPDRAFGPTVRGTAKGAIAHMRPPAESIAAMDRTAVPRAVVFIEYLAGAAAALEPFPKARAFLALADSSFNYHLRGGDGFRELARLIDGCTCWTLRYSTFDDAIPLLDALV